MTASKIPETHPCRLIVEDQDRHAIIQLMARHGVDWDRPPATAPYVFPAGSVEKAFLALSLALRNDLERVGLIVDADTDIASRWHAARDRFSRAGMTMPAHPPREGWVEQVGRRRVGVWLMPNNEATGNLEDFLARLVPEADPCWPHAQQSTAAASVLGAPFKAADHGKATMHAWLAWREEPGLPFGTAMKARYFAHDSPDALAFVGWFKRLFLET